MPPDTRPSASDDPFPEYGDYDARQKWFARRLEGRSREDCILIAARAALRVFPKINLYFQPENTPKTTKYFILLSIRCASISINSILYSEEKNDYVKERSQKIINFANEIGYRYDDKYSASTNSNAKTAAYGASVLSANAIYHPIFSAINAVSLSSFANAHTTMAFEADLENLDDEEQYGISTRLWDEEDLQETDFQEAIWTDADSGQPNWGISVINRLAASPLWLNEGGAPQDIRDNWKRFSAQLRALGDDWDVWADWYGGGTYNGKKFPGVLQGAQGGQYLFGLPTARALKLWHDVALLPNDLWEGEPAALNAKFKELVQEARGEENTGKAESAQPDVAPKTEKPKAAPKTKPAPKPKTALGKAVLANAGVLNLQIELIFPLIDREIERLQSEHPNSEEAIAKRDAEIAFLEQIKANATALKQTVLDYPEAKVGEAELKKTTNAFFKPLQECWEKKGEEFVEVGIRSGVFLAAMAISGSCGVPALAGTLVVGAITAGKPLAEVLKAARGVFKII